MGACEFRQQLIVMEGEREKKMKMKTYRQRNASSSSAATMPNLLLQAEELVAYITRPKQLPKI